MSIEQLWEDLELMAQNPDIVIGVFIGIIVLLILWSIAVSTINIRRW